MSGLRLYKGGTDTGAGHSPSWPEPAEVGHGLSSQGGLVYSRHPWLQMIRSAFLIQLNCYLFIYLFADLLGLFWVMSHVCVCVCVCGFFSLVGFISVKMSIWCHSCKCHVSAPCTSHHLPEDHRSSFCRRHRSVTLLLLLFLLFLLLLSPLCSTSSSGWSNTWLLGRFRPHLCCLQWTHHREHLIQFSPVCSLVLYDTY